MSDKTSAEIATIHSQARLCIATAAGQRGWNDTRQSWLARAARHFGMSPARTARIWYGVVRPYADEMDRMRVEAARLIREDEQQRGKNAEIQARLDALAVGPSVPLEC